MDDEGAYPLVTAREVLVEAGTKRVESTGITIFFGTRTCAFKGGGGTAAVVYC